MNGKRLVSALFFVFAVATIISAVAYVYAVSITSNEVTVNVSDYTLTVTDPADGTIYDTYTFSGSLQLDGSSVSGKTVTLYVKPSGGAYSTTGLTDVTDSMGGYSMTWTPSSAGTYTFKTMATI